MNVAARIGLTIVGAAAGGYGMYELGKLPEQRYVKGQAQLAADTTKATKEWQSWHSAFTAQFGDGHLDTPADHARFEAFLKANPAPKWVKVEHQDRTRVHLHADRAPVSDTTDHSADEQGDAYAIGFGGMFAVGGAAASIANIAKGGTTGMTLAATLGGGLAMAFGVESAIQGVQDLRRPDGLDGMRHLLADVNASA